MNRSLGKSVLAASIAGLFCAGANVANGAGFALTEQSASGLGNAYAGAAAVAEDASTIYFNPAGMSLLGSSQFVAAGQAIKLDATFAGTATNPGLLGGGAGTGGNGGQQFAGMSRTESFKDGDTVVADDEHRVISLAQSETVDAITDFARPLGFSCCKQRCCRDKNGRGQGCHLPQNC